MTTFKPFCIALIATFSVFIPFRQVEAATFFAEVDDQSFETEVELTSGNNIVLDPDFDLNSLISDQADDRQMGKELVTSNNFVYPEAEAVEEIPEPSTLLALCLVGLFSKLGLKKQ